MRLGKRKDRAVTERRHWVCARCCITDGSHLLLENPGLPHNSSSQPAALCTYYVPHHVLRTRPIDERNRCGPNPLGLV